MRTIPSVIVTVLLATLSVSAQAPPTENCLTCDGGNGVARTVPRLTLSHPVVAGLLVGAGAGAGLSAATCSPNDTDRNPDVPCGVDVAAGAGGGALLGGLTGWIISLAR